MRITMLVCMLAACGPSLHEIAAHNQREVKRADKTAASAGGPFTPAAVAIPRDDAALPGMTSLEPGETIHADPATRELVFVSEACLQREVCFDECRIPVAYTFHHATDGHVVILRRKVVLHAVRSEKDNTCPAGCGGGAQRPEIPPPAELAGHRLGTTELAQVELRTVTRSEQYVEHRCTNTTPVP